MQMFDITNPQAFFVSVNQRQMCNANNMHLVLLKPYIPVVCQASIICSTSILDSVIVTYHSRKAHKKGNLSVKQLFLYQ